MDVSLYKKTQSDTDGSKKLTERALRSLLLYLYDLRDRSLSEHQRLESLEAAKTLCDVFINFMNENIPPEEAEIYLKFFAHLLNELVKNSGRLNRSNSVFVEHERFIVKLLELL